MGRRKEEKREVVLCGSAGAKRKKERWQGGWSNRGGEKGAEVGSVWWCGVVGVGGVSPPFTVVIVSPPCAFVNRKF